MNNYKLQRNNHSTVVKWVIAGIIIISNGIVFSCFSPLKALSQTSLDAKTQQAMIDAINDEYRSRALYNAVLHKFGSVRPFSNIVQAENNHVNLWMNLFAKYGIAVPTDSFAGNIKVNVRSLFGFCYPTRFKSCFYPTASSLSGKAFNRVPALSKSTWCRSRSQFLAMT